MRQASIEKPTNDGSENVRANFIAQASSAADFLRHLLNGDLRGRSSELATDFLLNQVKERLLRSVEISHEGDLSEWIAQISQIDPKTAKDYAESYSRLFQFLIRNRNVYDALGKMLGEIMKPDEIVKSLPEIRKGDFSAINLEKIVEQ